VFREAPALTGEPVAVFAFRNYAERSDSSGLGQKAAGRLLDNLRASGQIRLLSVSAQAAVSDADGRREGQTSEPVFETADSAGAGQALVGVILRESPFVIIGAHLIDIPSGDVVKTERVIGSSAALDGAVDSLAARIAAYTTELR